MSNLVQIEPIKKTKCLGNNGDEYFTCPIVIEALKNDMGMLETGLTEKETAELQKHFYYSLDPKYDPLDDKSIWNHDEGRFIMQAKTHILDLDKPVDRLRYALCKASKYVANSQQELDEHKWPYAKFVIVNSAEQAEATAKRNELKLKVMALIDKMDTTQKRNFCMIFGFNVKGQTDTVISNKVFEVVETKGYKASYEVMKQSKEYNTLHALVAEALERHVINKKGEVYQFMDEPIGVSVSSVIEYLRDTKNNAVKMSIIKMLNE